MTFISYAQNFEDVMLLRALGHIEGGFYIDVGAADPEELSVTKAFYDRGWRGINVEPLPFYFDRLTTARPRDINLSIAIAQEAGELAFFEIEDTGLSTLNPDVAEAHRSDGRSIRPSRIKVTTLADLCREHVVGPVHFLKIDVEGGEQAVLAGADFKLCRPWIILIEATKPLSEQQNHHEWEAMLQQSDYRFVWFDGLNRFYIADEHWPALAEAFSRPANVFDAFARAGDAGIFVQPVEARAVAAEQRAAAEAQRADEAEARLAGAQARLHEAKAQASRAKEQANRAEARYAEARAREAQAEVRAAQEASAYQIALQQITAIRATTSWSVTAPLRAFKLTLRGNTGLALAEVGVPLARLQRLKRVGGADGNRPKQAMRIGVYVASRAMARLTAAAKVANGLSRLAPGPTGWISRRLDAYLASALSTHPEPTAAAAEVAVTLPTAPIRPQIVAATGHRTRIVHQFHSGSSTGDAITNSMFLIQESLRKLGYRSDIFVEHRHPRLADRLFEISDLPLHGDYVLIVHHSFGYDALSSIIALPARKILMYHNITPAEFLTDFALMIPYAELGRRQLAVLRTNVDAALADSEFNALELRGHGYDAPIACPLLFDVDELIRKAGEAQHRPAGAPFTLLFVGRVVASKGQAELVDAFAEFHRLWHNPCRLVLVGRMAADDAAYPIEVRARIAHHELEAAVTVTGPVSDDELHAWYRAADVFVSLSHHEGFGVPLIEAMIHDVPVVAWPAGAVPYTMAGSGELLPDRSPAATAAAVLRVASNPDLRSDIIRRQRRVLESFRLDRHLPRLVQALASAGAAPPPEPSVRHVLSANLRFAITGHVSHTYSLSSVNREMALALETHRPGSVRLLPVEGGPTSDISSVPSWHADQVAELVRRPVPSTGPEVVISQHYPIFIPESRGDLTVAMVFWEESLLPQPIIRTLNENFDAVLAPTTLVAKVLVDSGLALPVRVAGYAPNLLAFHRLGTERNAARPSRGPVVSFLHVSSCFPRKGVDILLAAYAKAFRKGDAVRLIIKGFPNPHNDVPEQIDQLRERNPDIAAISMINDDLDEAGMVDLYRQADVVVLPTRGEGFNIPAAEAMAAGIPLIVTGQGGHLDFCTAHDARLIDYRFAPSASHLATTGSVWLEPEIDDLVAAMREVVADLATNGGASLARATRARSSIGLRLDPDRWADRLSDIAVELLTRPRSIPPRLAWVSTWAVPCGIAEYSRSLLEGFGPGKMSITVLSDDRTAGLAGDANVGVQPAWMVGEDGNMDRMARMVANLDPEIVVVQYHEGLFRWRALVAFLTDPRVSGRVTVVTLHAAQRFADLEAEDVAALAAALRRTTRVLVHRIADLEALKSFGLEANVTLITQGTPKLFASPRIRTLSSRDTALIGCYGFFLPGKGIARLIEAFASLRREWPKLRLRLVNAEYPYIDSPLEIGRCRQLAASLRVEKTIEWETSFKPQEQCQLLLSECDLVVLPYDESRESSSAALRGALSSGAPVAVTPVTIFDEADDAVHRFAASDVQSVATGIDALLRDAKVRDRMQVAASKWLANHQWSVIAERMEGMLTGMHLASAANVADARTDPSIGETPASTFAPGTKR